MNTQRFLLAVPFLILLSLQPNAAAADAANDETIYYDGSAVVPDVRHDPSPGLVQKKAALVARLDVMSSTAQTPEENEMIFDCQSQLKNDFHEMHWLPEKDYRAFLDKIDQITSSGYPTLDQVKEAGSLSIVADWRAMNAARMANGAGEVRVTKSRVNPARVTDALTVRGEALSARLLSLLDNGHNTDEMSIYNSLNSGLSSARSQYVEDLLPPDMFTSILNDLDTTMATGFKPQDVSQWELNTRNLEQKALKENPKFQQEMRQEMPKMIEKMERDLREYSDIKHYRCPTNATGPFPRNVRFPNGSEMPIIPYCKIQSPEGESATSATRIDE